MTPSELAAALDGGGYTVSVRTLRRWREVGLLPKLRRASRGRGQGVQRYWAENDILDRAILVYALMRELEDSNINLLRIWFAGFEVDPEIIKPIWLQFIDRDLAPIRKTLEKETDPSEYFDNLAVRIVRKADRATHSPDDVAFGLAEFLNAYFSETYRSTEEARNFVEGALDVMLSGVEPFGVTPGTLAPQLLPWFRTVVSISSANQQIRRATHSDLSNAHRVWRNILRLIGSMTAGKQDNQGTIRRLGIAFGGLGIRFLLISQRSRFRDRIARTIQIGEELYDLLGKSEIQFENGKIIVDQESQRRLESVAKKFATIWEGIEFTDLLTALREAAADVGDQSYSELS
jgi:DNA-binding transcriptional MerR regulator